MPVSPKMIYADWSPREIYALRVRLARCALCMSIKEFAAFVKLSPGTISSVENAKPTYSRISETIDEKLSAVSFLKCFRDDGRSIGVRLYYTKVPSAKMLEQAEPEQFPPPIRKSDGKIYLDNEGTDRLFVKGENPVLVWRQHLGFTSAELAREAGITVDYLTEVELGRRVASVRVISKLARALGIDRGELTRKYPPPRDIRRDYDPNEE
jgi:transcriptional regulator with XRE-family HTH domain